MQVLDEYELEATSSEESSGSSQIISSSVCLLSHSAVVQDIRRLDEGLQRVFCEGKVSNGVLFRLQEFFYSLASSWSRLPGYIQEQKSPFL